MQGKQSRMVILGVTEYQIKQIVKKLLLPLCAIAQHHNGARRNDSLLRPGPVPLDYSMLKVW